MLTHRCLWRGEYSRSQKWKSLKRSTSAANLLPWCDGNQEKVMENLESIRREDVEGQKLADVRCYPSSNRDLYDISEGSADCPRAQARDFLRIGIATPSRNVTLLCFLWKAITIETWIMENVQRMPSGGYDYSPQSLSAFIKKYLIFTRKLNSYEARGMYVYN